MTPELYQFKPGPVSARTLNAEQFKQLRELIGDDYISVTRTGDSCTVSLNTQKFLARVPQLGALLMVTSAAAGSGKYFGVVVLGDPTDVSPGNALSLTDPGEAVDDIVVLIENVPENNHAGHAFTSFPFFALGELSGTCDASTGKRVWRISRERPLAVGYDNCGAELVVQTPADHLDFKRRHFNLYGLAGVSNEAAVAWSGFDVRGSMFSLGGCCSGEADNVEGILFTDFTFQGTGTDLNVCFMVDATTLHRANDPCGDLSLSPWARVKAKVTIPNSYVTLPPYVPPVTTPPIYVPPATTPPQIVWIVPPDPGGGEPIPPPYITIIGGAQDYDDIPDGTGTLTISGNTITLTQHTRRRTYINGIAQPLGGAGEDRVYTGSCS